MYKHGKEFKEDGIIKKWIGKMTHIVQEQRWKYKQHLNQLKWRFTVWVSLQKRYLWKYCMKHLMSPTPLETVELRVYTKRKRTPTESLNIEMKLKKYRHQRKSSEKGGVV